MSTALPRAVVSVALLSNTASLTVAANAPDVLAGEVGLVLLKLAVELLGNPGKRFVSIDEISAAQEEASLLASHPAVRLYVRDGEQIWLGVHASQLWEMHTRGWVDAGAVPEGVKRVCDHARDPEAFAARMAVLDA